MSEQDPWKVKAHPYRYKPNVNEHECRKEVLKGGMLRNTFVEKDEQGWYLRVSIGFGDHKALYHYDFQLSVKPEITNCPYCGIKLE